MTIGPVAYKGGLLSEGFCIKLTRPSYSPSKMPKPLLFKSIRIDKGTVWGRKHQTLGPLGTGVSLPSAIDLRPKLDSAKIEVYNQVQFDFKRSSLTAHSISDATGPCHNRETSIPAQPMQSVPHGDMRNPWLILGSCLLDFLCTIMSGASKEPRPKIPARISVMGADRSPLMVFALSIHGLTTRK